MLKNCVFLRMTSWSVKFLARHKHKKHQQRNPYKNIVAETRLRADFLRRQYEQNKKSQYDPKSRNVYRKIEDEEDVYASDREDYSMWNLSDEVSKEEQRGAKQRKKQPNLLTWAAKMQIRFLHAEDPYQWTPEVLADSFPTTKENIIAILKSTWLPVDEKQIERHDRRVHQNWLTLQKELKKNQKEAVERTGGKIQGEGQVDERIVKILNAAGIPSLPGPSQDEILLTRKKLTEKLYPKVSGAFSQILLDYKVQFKVADKDKLKISEEPHKTAFAIGDKEAVPLLTSISSMSLNDTETGSNDGNDATERMAGFRTERNLEIEHDQSLSESAKSQQVISSLRQSRRQRRLRETTVTKDNLEELQMQGTGKVS